MDLILWRHAEAREIQEGESDLERPLTSRGMKQADRMAEWLNRFLPQSTKILVSPSLRTRENAPAFFGDDARAAPVARSIPRLPDPAGELFRNG